MSAKHTPGVRALSEYGRAPRGCCTEYRCARAKPLLIRRSGLTGRWYVVTDYRPRADGILAVRKHDVTNELRASLLAEGWTPPADDRVTS